MVHGSAILRHLVGIFSWLLLALQVKVGTVASFVGKIFVVRPPTTKTTNIFPHENYTLYGSTTQIVLVIVQYMCYLPRFYDRGRGIVGTIALSNYLIVG